MRPENMAALGRTPRLHGARDTDRQEKYIQYVGRGSQHDSLALYTRAASTSSSARAAMYLHAGPGGVWNAHPAKGETSQFHGVEAIPPLCSPTPNNDTAMPPAKGRETCQLACRFRKPRVSRISVPILLSDRVRKHNKSGNSVVTRALR